MEFKPWKIAVHRRKNAASQADGLPGFLQAVLEGRGFGEPETAREFLEGPEGFHDPMALADMDKAVARVRRAIQENEKILVYGDYDCDGVTATVILYDYLENAGADVLYYIPAREEEGYGLNKSAIDKMKEAGVALIITVDNGITALEEVAYAGSLGIDVVVTDHHRPGETLPEAAAVVDPHRSGCTYPFPDLCGAGVAFKLVCALEEDAEGMLLEHYGDLLAIGTVADLVPLTGENRALVKAGIALLAESENLGIQALARKAGLDLSAITSENIAFGIAPRINVTGRIGSVDQAVELLLCRDEDRAAQLAGEICALNDRRKELEGEIIQDIQLLLEREPQLLDRRVLVLSGEGWNPGVIGIIAARMVERYGKPCILLSILDGEARGSARSVEGFSIIEAIRSQAEYLEKCGGHPMAAGLTLPKENISAFAQGLEDYAREQYPSMPLLTLGVDTIVRLGEATLDNAKQLERLEPFGCGNPQPVLALVGAKVAKLVPMGKEGNHLRITLEQDGISAQAVLFGTGPEYFPLEEGELADVAFVLSVNTFNGSQRPQLRILSIRPHGFDMAGKLKTGAAYQSLRRGEEPEEPLTFNREDLTVVFRWLRRHTPWKKGTDLLAHRLGNSSSYGKVLAALDILCELGLISQKNQRGAETIEVLPAVGKAELDASPTYRIFQEKLVN